MTAFIIIITVLVFVLLIQLGLYSKLDKKISLLQETLNKEFVYDELNKKIIKDDQNDKEIEKNIKENINLYLSNNTNPSVDIIEGIVNREIIPVCDSIESMIPVPLYIGLMGTVSCIIITLWFNNWENVSNLSGLLKEIAPSMLATFFGVLFTCLQTGNYVKAKDNFAKNKNKFFFNIVGKIISTSNSIRHSFDPQTDISKTMTENQILILEKFNDSMSKFTALTQSMERLQQYVEETRNMLDKYDKLIETVKENESYFNNLSINIKKIAIDFKEDLEKVVFNSVTNITSSFYNIDTTIKNECDIKDQVSGLSDEIRNFVKEEHEALKEKRVVESLRDIPGLLNDLKGLKEAVSKHTESNKKMSESIDDLSSASKSMVDNFPTSEGNLAHSEAMLKWIKISAITSDIVAVLVGTLIGVYISMSRPNPVINNTQQVQATQAESNKDSISADKSVVKTVKGNVQKK